MTANLKYPGLPVEDYGHAVAEFGNGVIATIEDTWTAAPGGFRISMNMVGEFEGVRARRSLRRLSRIVERSASGGISCRIRPAAGVVVKPVSGGLADRKHQVLTTGQVGPRMAEVTGHVVRRQC